MTNDAKRPEDDEAPTSDQLRARIDRGETGDKVDNPDPAAVPLGADAEAGGNPPTADQLRAEIDSSATGEKVNNSDPAAAPLEADAEVGGTPPTKKELQVENKERRPLRERAKAAGQPNALLATVAGIAVVCALLIAVSLSLG